jgi:hypothetical protein
MIWQGCERKHHGLIEGITPALPQENEDKYQKDSQSPNQDPNWAPPKYKSEASLLEPTPFVTYMAYTRGRYKFCGHQ